MSQSQAIRAQGSYLQRGAMAAVLSKVISTMTAVGATVTVTTATAHGLVAGSIVTHSGATPSAYNGQFVIATVPNATTYTFAALIAPGGDASVVGTYTAHNVAYALFEESSSIKLGGVSVSSIDTTHLLSEAKEFVAGLQDNGTCEISANFINGTVQGLVRADMNAGATSAYQIVIPGKSNNTVISFSGFVTKYAGPDLKTDGKVEISVTIKITGAITIVNQ